MKSFILFLLRSIFIFFSTVAVFPKLMAGMPYGTIGLVGLFIAWVLFICAVTKYLIDPYVKCQSNSCC